MKVGYARVSTPEQNLDLQLDALQNAGCEVVFRDEGISAIAPERPQFETALNSLKSGDIFVIWKMDRAFRSLNHALSTLENLEQRGIEFQAITEQIETITALGRFNYQIRNAFAELERALISERTKAGMEAARARGVHVGRPRKLTIEQTAQAKREIEAGNHSTASMAKILNVSPQTLTRAILKPVEGI